MAISRKITVYMLWSIELDFKSLTHHLDYPSDLRLIDNVREVVSIMET